MNTFETAKRSFLAPVILVVLYLLMFWSDLPSFRPGMDSMTYGAIAKNILTTGDWAVLHYTAQAYADFFQHPPLTIWMMAISMKLVSALAGPKAASADWVLKILPALVAALGAWGIYLWARRIRGEWFAFLACVILLTSTRYAKYSKGFMLDPFLAAFSVWSIYFLFRSRDSRRSELFAFLAGISVAFAFLSKGLFAFAPFAIALTVLAANYGSDFGISTRGRAIPRALFYLIGTGLPIAAWFIFGDAAHYLERYYIEHVAGRVGSHPLRDHFGPILNLLKVYWPWFFFYVLGAAAILKSFPRKIGRPTAEWLSREETVACLTSLAFIGGFTLVASFLEQYHTATYPFAAIVAAFGIPSGWERYRKQIEKSMAVLLTIAVAAIVISPSTFRGREALNPMRIVLKEARVACTDTRIRRLSISTGAAEIWYALAMGSWNTDWDARSDAPEKAPKDADSQILLAAKTDSVGTGWIETGIESEGLRIFRSAEVEPCAQ